MKSNAYSDRWFRFFHSGISATRTSQETDFVCACAPLPHFRKVVDVCCGMGRHARALVRRGYSVTGIERDALAFAKAQELAGGPTYIRADIRDYLPNPCAYDAAIVMSQSFGYFSPATNREVLRRLTTGLREGGRIILDLWNPEFFVNYPGDRDLELCGGIVREQKHMQNNRLFVRLDYPDGTADEFDWQLFTPMEMSFLADSIGLDLIVCCTDFDIATKPCPEKSRIQFTLEHRTKRSHQ
ncbi:MAG TPA: class I SAM-dependent methyltransferase [Chthoniobacterales bacterium]